MNTLTPSALHSLCQALTGGTQMGAFHGRLWIELTLDPPTIHHGVTSTRVVDLTGDLADVWRNHAPAWCQAAVDGRDVARVVAQDDDADQITLWGDL